MTISADKFATDWESFEEGALTDWIRRNPPHRVVYVTIVTVPSGGNSNYLVEHVGGGQEAMPYPGPTLPIVGDRWRAVCPWGGSFRLDDVDPEG